MELNKFQKLMVLSLIILTAIILIFSSGCVLNKDDADSLQTQEISSTNNLMKNNTGTGSNSDEFKEEPTYAFHGFHVTILNLSESEYRDTPRNSTLEEISSRGYEIISIVPEDIEKYSYLKDGLKPGAPNGEFTRALEDEEKDNFFEKFYGKCFSYRGHNYVIDSFKN